MSKTLLKFNYTQKTRKSQVFCKLFDTYVTIKAYLLSLRYFSAQLQYFLAHVQCQSIFGHFLGNGAAGTDVGVGLYSNRSNKVGVAADEGVVTDNGAVLLLAVVVDGDAATAHVNAATDVAVTDVGEMRQLGAFAYVRVFNLYIVADLTWSLITVSGRRCTYGPAVTWFLTSQSWP